MEVSERKAFSDAVMCLQSLPPKTPNGFAAGIKTRYDDFVWTHINQTNYIHFTVSMLYIIGPYIEQKELTYNML